MNRTGLNQSPSCHRARYTISCGTVAQTLGKLYSITPPKLASPHEIYFSQHIRDQIIDCKYPSEMLMGQTCLNIPLENPEPQFYFISTVTNQNFVTPHIAD